MSDGNGDSSNLSGYQDKFQDFIRLCDESEKGDMLQIATPHALGDNYEELIESLNRIADAELHLAVVPRKER